MSSKSIKTHIEEIGNELKASVECREWYGWPGVVCWRFVGRANKLDINLFGYKMTTSANMVYWFINILWYEAFGVGFGIVMLWYYSKKRHWPHGTENSAMAAQGWPEIPALATGTSIMGSALSFLLVFRLSWSFGRWWEARGLIGTAMTKMRNLASMITANSDAPSVDQAMALLELRLVCKLHVATMVDILVQEAAQSVDQKRMRSSRSVRKLLQDLDRDELHALGQERARLLARSDRRILLCHSWLAHAIRNCSDLGLLRAFEQESALDCQNQLLHCFYSSMKIKTTPIPSGIQTITVIIRFAFCIILFPQFMAYNFVTKLSPLQSQKNLVWDRGSGIYICWYLALTSIVIAFFSVIHIVSLELDDPYGEDDSDLPLEKMVGSMWSDLDSINSTFIDNSRLGQGTGLHGLVRSKSTAVMTKVVGKRGSDDVYKSSPASAAGAVYAPKVASPAPVGEPAELTSADSIVAEVGTALGVYGNDYASVNPTEAQKIREKDELQQILKETFAAPPPSADGPVDDPPASAADAGDEEAKADTGDA